MKNTIIIILIMVLGIAGLIWLGSKSQNSTTKFTPKTGEKSLLVTSESLYDFGTISMKDGNVSKDFTVTNNTNKDIEISTILTSCMCTTALIVRKDGTTNGPFGMSGMGYVPPANEMIPVGENLLVRVTYDPNAHGPAGVGVINRFINLTDNSGNTTQLEIKAIVTP